ncbi:hypothetical protein LCGC14_0609200 [marine sediment metagenome]|uniref:HK97 family phage prohead protease n=1 Tax=marine sediment metagenome TaxID=412755 RepID=A0A0F9RSJ4_9ZZZZ
MIKKENQKPPELVTKCFRAEIKEIDKDNHTVVVTMSNQTLDSYGDIIAADGWKKHLGRYKAHPVLLSSHNYGSLQNQIGISEKTFVQDNALKARLKYFVGAGNQEADWGWALAERGIAAYSVGFRAKAVRYWNEMTEEEQAEARIKYNIPKKATPFRIFLEQELLENSQVVIPANPDADKKISAVRKRDKHSETLRYCSIIRHPGI